MKNYSIILFIIIFIILFFIVVNFTLKKYNIQEKFENSSTIQIYIGLTTIPPRLKYLHNTLNSLLSQKVLPNKIYVFIPPESKRLKQNYDISLIQKDKINDPDNRIEYITDIQDEGPITKFYGLLDIVPKNNNNYLILVDDDVIYPKMRLSELINNIDLSTQNAHGFSGRIYKKSNENKSTLKFHSNPEQPLEVDILETFDMAAYPRSIFPQNSQEFIQWYHQLPDDAFFVDDIVLSYWVKTQEKKKIIYKKSEGNLYYSQVDNIPEEVQKIELKNDNVNGRNMSVYKKIFLQSP